MYFERLRKYLDLQSQCDGDKTSFMKHMQIFEDLSNKTLVLNDPSSRHFNNRVATISTNGHKTRVSEEHSLYGDATALMSRGDGNSDLP